MVPDPSGLGALFLAKGVSGHFLGGLLRVSWASCGSLAASQNPLALCIKSGGDQGSRGNGSGPWGQQKKRKNGFGLKRRFRRSAL